MEVAFRGLSFVEAAELDEMGQGAAGNSTGDQTDDVAGNGYKDLRVKAEGLGCSVVLGKVFGFR